ncbi:MAG: PHP domain-containing protein [Christensenellales bacterium]
MKIAVDLHIHSCLSPCADSHMTPCNIAGMAKLKGLDAIAVTDHNHAGNLISVCSEAAKHGLIVVPGIEVQSKEEVHLLCYFEDIERAVAFGERIYQTLMPVSNNPGLFGRQLLIDTKDQVAGELDTLLIQSSALSISQICDEVSSNNGVVVPAHINRQANSLLAMLGFIPPGLGFSTLEVCAGIPMPSLAGYQFIRSSDAHELGAILEREIFLEVKEKTVPYILAWLKGKY